jgi:hypothetical protein
VLKINRLRSGIDFARIISEFSNGIYWKGVEAETWSRFVVLMLNFSNVLEGRQVKNKKRQVFYTLFRIAIDIIV